MKGMNYSKLLLLTSLSASSQAQPPAEIKLGLTQLTGQHCREAHMGSNKALPGDCITYRIKVENIGGSAAKNVVVSGLIPEHTILRSKFRDVASQENLDTVVEQKSDGTQVVKTTIDTILSDQKDTIVLEYSVMVL